MLTAPSIFRAPSPPPKAVESAQPAAVRPNRAKAPVKSACLRFILFCHALSGSTAATPTPYRTLFTHQGTNLPKTDFPTALGFSVEDSGVGVMTFGSGINVCVSKLNGLSAGIIVLPSVTWLEAARSVCAVSVAIGAGSSVEDSRDLLNVKKSLRLKPLLSGSI